MDNRLKSATDGALKQLTSALEAGQSDTLKAYLKAMGMFHHYSWSNCLLIYTQKPEATQVAGFHTWKSMSRYVKAGEKGILIVVPMYCRPKEGDRTEEGETILRFTSGYVFDVSQTDGDPMVEFDTVRGDPGCYLLFLKDYIRELDIELTYADLRGAQGQSSGGRITIQSGLPPAEEFSVLCHELAHEFLHKGDRRANTNKRIRELEAEAVAYVVCCGIGLENTGASVDYIQLYKGDAVLLSASLNFIQQASNQILEALL